MTAKLFTTPVGWVRIGPQSFVRLRDIRRVYAGKRKPDERTGPVWILLNLQDGEPPKPVECHASVRTIMERVGEAEDLLDQVENRKAL